MFIITHGDGTDGTTDGDGTTGVGPDTTDMAVGMTLSGDQAMAGTTGVGPDTTDMAVGTGLIIIIALIIITITGIADITTIIIAGEGTTGMLSRIPQTGHTPEILTPIEEIQILPITEGVPTLPIIEIQLITGEAQIPHTVEEAMTIAIIQAEEIVETQIRPIAIAEG